MNEVINAYLSGIIALLGFLTSNAPLHLLALGTTWILGLIALFIYISIPVMILASIVQAIVSPFKRKVS